MKLEKEKWAEVSFSLGKTFNMGDFESLRIQVGLTVPCKPDEVEDTFEAVSGKVVKMLNRKSKEIVKK